MKNFKGKIFLFLLVSLFSIKCVDAAKVQSNQNIDCANVNAVSCNQYIFTNQRKNHVSIEIGKTSYGNYLYLSFDNFKNILTRNNNGQIVVDTGGVGNDVYEVKDDAIWDLDSDGKYGQLDIRYDTNFSNNYYIYKKQENNEKPTVPPAYGDGTVTGVEENNGSNNNNNNGNDSNSSDISGEVPDFEIKPIEFCEQARVLNAFKIGGYALFVIKILVPLLLMGLAVWDLLRAMISSDDKANKEAVSKLIRRAIIAVIIFVIPTLLDYAFLLVDGAVDTTNEFSKCTSCLFNPMDCDTEE